MSDFELPFLHRKMLRFEQATKFALVVQSNSVVATTVVVRGATRDGLFTIKHTTTSNEVTQTESFNLPDIPIWVSATVTKLDVEPDQVYVQLSFALDDDIMQPLCAGYIFGTNTVSWPSNNLKAPIPDAWSAPKTFSVTNPAAGSNFTFTGRIYSFAEIQSITFTLTTSATVANRRVHLSIFDGGLGNLDFHSSIDQTASQVRNYTCCAIGGAGSYANDNDIIIPIPPGLKGFTEYTISSDILNLQAGDQLTFVRVNLIEKRSTMYF